MEFGVQFFPMSGRKKAPRARAWTQATFLLHSRFEAMSAPPRNVASFRSRAHRLVG